MNIRSSTPPRASVIAFNFGISSLMATSVSLMNTLPLTSTESCSGVLSCSRLLAWVCGRSSGTPTVSSGADTMKMISSTSMTSTIGVTLISAMTGLRRCRRLPATAAAPEFMPMAIPLPLLVDLPRQNGGEFVGEALQPLRLLVHIGNELVIKNGRRYGGEEPDCGREQGFRNPGGDHRERGGLLAGNGPKA